MLISKRLPALVEEVEGFCQPHVIQGGDSQVMNSYLIPGLRSNMRQVIRLFQACKQEVEWQGSGRKQVFWQQGKRLTTLKDCQLIKFEMYSVGIIILHEIKIHKHENLDIFDQILFCTSST